MAIRERDYQTQARREAFAAWEQGQRAHLAVAPTGAGKTLVEVKVAQQWLRQKGGRILVLAQDSRELVNQLGAAFRRHSKLSVGIETSEQRVKKNALPKITCATTQAVHRRLSEYPRNAFSLIIEDEADHAASPSWKAIHRHFWNARIFGCTATPNRHDGKRVPFDSAHRAATHRGLIDDGRISPIEVRDVRVVDRRLIVLPSGKRPDDDEAVQRIWKEEGALHEIVEPTIRLAGDRAAIVFTRTVQHARQLAAMFNRYRPSSARAVWGSMPRDERKDAFAAFESRRFQFITNAGLIGRGVDLPFVSCIVMARATYSRTFYEQAIGRGWRAHPGKDRLLVLDFCENAERHRLLEVVSLLTGRDHDAETIERAGERLDESCGGDVVDALNAAKQDLLDDSVRERIRAKITTRTRTIDLLTDSISDETWRTKNNKEIAAMLGLNPTVVARRRPESISSPGRAQVIDVTDEEWRTLNNRELGKLKGVHYLVIRDRRPVHFPSPGLIAKGKHKGRGRNVKEPSRQSWLQGVVDRERWRQSTNTELAIEFGLSWDQVRKLRPADAPSPAKNPRWLGMAGAAAIARMPRARREEIREKQRDGGRKGWERSSLSKKK